MTPFLELPLELVDTILESMSCKELSNLSKCNKTFHYLAFQKLFVKAFENTLGSADKKKDVREVVTSLFMHVVKLDSQNIIQFLVFHESSYCLRERTTVINNLTHLHYAILSDAPMVANGLVKHGTDVCEEDSGYPDVTPLYLAIARPSDCVHGQFDTALRIACSYALPRTARCLLARGADANSFNSFKLAAMHVTLARRLPWKKFKLLSWMNGEKEAESFLWRARINETLAVLLQFGADLNLQTRNARRHLCGHSCWKSLDCDHQGQRPLHFAAASGNEEAMSLLLNKGASAELTDDEGYTPLFPAMAQGHDKVTSFLLAQDDGFNPIVMDINKSTALHIACRFAREDVVVELLRRGASINATDRLGRTPLHECLMQTYPTLENDVLAVLSHLSGAGASPDAVTLEGKSAQSMGERHNFARVREMFEYVEEDSLLTRDAFCPRFTSDVLGIGNRWLYLHEIENPSRASWIEDDTSEETGTSLYPSKLPTSTWVQGESLPPLGSKNPPKPEPKAAAFWGNLGKPAPKPAESRAGSVEPSKTVTKGKGKGARRSGFPWSSDTSMLNEWV
ncbi:Serine/threonine-protein phosphatase 6 regulatory ankyrin repeat subunit B-like protein [Cladobotryum mycophilum]|uniref:Serine/threonine-protein phosphatase 6 regulatory ankyrin repeat subunit B-like protein n=1 Tax=Cladobotryum mycophilum TaxID=491253 RepID=A0ABR0SXI8_9HYPO